MKVPFLLACGLICLSEAAESRSDRFAVRHIESGGIGYNQGYTTTEVFLAADPSTWSYVPFLDVRGHVFDNGRFAANAGVGVRSLFGCRAYGINAYYDYRNTRHLNYNQVALGLETLGDLWDLRINGYLPVGSKKSSPYSPRFDSFSGNEMIVSQKFQYAMGGADAELGFHVGCWNNIDCYAAIGPYYFIGPVGGSTWGGKARVGASFYEYVTLEFINSYDNTFNYRPQGQLTLTLPFGPKAKTSSLACPLSLGSRMVQPVARQEIVVLNTSREESVAIDPTTDEPFFFVFVNNQSHSAGTFDSPYPTLAQAETGSGPGNIIYVFPGDGTTTGMDAGIALQTDQYFWGSGTLHFLSTTQGLIAVPAQTETNPIITNTTGDGVTLASGNDVSGFVISRTSNDGISGDAISSVLLSDLTIFGATDGISLTNLNGAAVALSNVTSINNTSTGASLFATAGDVNLTVDSCTFNTNNDNGITAETSGNAVLTALFNDNVLQNNAAQGINVDSTSDATDTLVLTFTNNLIQGNQNRAISGDFTGSAPIAVVMTENVIVGQDGDPTDHGIAFFNFSGSTPSTLVATGNQLNQNTYPGSLYIQAGAAEFTGLIQNNTLNENCSQAIQVDSIGTSPVYITLNDNTLFGNCSEGFFFQANVPDGNLTVSATGNTLEGNCFHGIIFTKTGSGNYASTTVTLTDNIFNGNAGDAIRYDVDMNTLSLTMDGNVMTGQSGTGVFVGNFTYNDITIASSNNTITNNNNGGMTTSSSTIVQNLTISSIGDTITGNAQSAIFAQGTISQDMTIIIQNGQFNGNCNGAVEMEPTGPVNATITVTDSTLNGNCGGGIYIDGHFGESLTFTATGNTIDGNCGSAITVNNHGHDAAATTLTIANNSIANTAADAILITANLSGTQTFSTELTGNTIAYTNTGGNTAYGVNFDYTGSSTGSSSFVASGNTLLANGSDGILVTVGGARTGGSLTTHIADNTFTGQLGNGLNINADPSGTGFQVLANLSGNTASNNNLRGISVSSAGTAQTTLAVTNNTLFSNAFLESSPFEGLQVTNSAAGASTCLTLTGNTSDTGYLLTQSAGTFNLAPLDATSLNTGTINTSGTVTPVSSCP